MIQINTLLAMTSFLAHQVSNFRVFISRLVLGVSFGFAFLGNIAPGHCHEITAQSPKAVVVLTQFVSHEALNAVRDGAVEIIKDCAGSRYDLELVFSNASGNSLVARQIAQKHVSENPDVIVAISTLSAQSMIGASRGRIPVIFGAVTDPKSAQIVGKNITGVTDKAPFKEQLEFIQTVMPGVQSIGVFFNPGEDNSRAALVELAPIFKDLGLMLVPVAVTKVVEINQAVQKVHNQIDAIFVANDNLIASGFESLVLAARKEKIPVFASDVMLVHRGAVAMRGIDYFQTGQQIGLQVCSILDGAPTADIDVQNPADLKLIVNLKAAKSLGLEIPRSILENADLIIGNDLTDAQMNTHKALVHKNLAKSPS